MGNKRTKWWKSGPPSRSPGKEVLEEMYVSEGMSLEDIAGRLGVSKQSVWRWLRAAGIPRRDVSLSTSMAQKGRKPSAKKHEALKRNLEKARANVTAESRAKQAAKMRGKPAPNKGKPWTPEARAKHMATRTSDEYRRAAAERQRGEKANNWQGGVTEPRRSPNDWEWRKRRRECYERDDWTCQDCGEKCMNRTQAKTSPGSRIQAHHIVPRRFGGTDELENLVTLCARCHGIRERRHEGFIK